MQRAPWVEPLLRLLAWEEVVLCLRAKSLEGVSEEASSLFGFLSDHSNAEIPSRPLDLEREFELGGGVGLLLGQTNYAYWFISSGCRSSGLAVLEGGECSRDWVC